MCRRVANCTGVVCLSLFNMGLDMNDRYRLFQNHARGGSYYIQDNVTHKQESLLKFISLICELRVQKS